MRGLIKGVGFLHDDDWGLARILEGWELFNCRDGSMLCEKPARGGRLKLTTLLRAFSASKVLES